MTQGSLFNNRVFLVFMADYNESIVSWKVSELLFSWLTWCFSFHMAHVVPVVPYRRIWSPSPTLGYDVLVAHHTGVTIHAEWNSRPEAWLCKFDVHFLVKAGDHLGGGNSNMFYFHPYLGFHDPIWRAYFSNGLVQPPTSHVLMPPMFFHQEKTMQKSFGAPHLFVYRSITNGNL